MTESRNQFDWRNLIERLGLSDLGGTTHAKLVDAYSGPTRHYHSVAHIEDCLNQLADCTLPQQQSDPMALALWFHDAVYNWRSKTNEADSAHWAREFLEGCDAAPELTTNISDLIMATRHFVPEPLVDDQPLLVDIDLSILGRTPEVYDHYEVAIREEYKWVPAMTYRRERRSILRAFLKRDIIYNTIRFQALYEDPARSNLKRAIEML
ncbi:MAG: putative metal-dependent HD superfamily phosphohydrolase [Hyphomicrobiaceae bacterium]|jgi:predicted metal-dependent HD superfamily phosphohydrolase